MTMLVGRRRVGKTELLKYCYRDDPNFLYFFCSRKSEILLCEEFKEILAAKISIPLWIKLDNFLGILEFLFRSSDDKPLTIVLDEFQDLNYISPAIFSGIQNLWDTYKDKSKLHLICCGSLYSLMCKLFEHSKEPLFGRADTKIVLKPLQPQYLRELLITKKKYNPRNLLDVYTIVGGVPRYLELFDKYHSWELSDILNIILCDNSFFLNEGKNVLIEEFGKEYKTYFSILALLASGHTSRSSIESVLQNSIGGYLDNLEHDYAIIKKYKPIFAKENSRMQKYCITDNFINFWFRYFYRHNTAIAIGNFQYVKDHIIRDYDTYSGRYLEQLIQDILAASGKYNEIGSYWDKNNNNEIDVVAVNTYEKKLVFCDIKLQTKNLNEYLLRQKATKLVQQHPGYTIEYRGYALEHLDVLIDQLKI